MVSFVQLETMRRSRGLTALRLHQTQFGLFPLPVPSTETKLTLPDIVLTASGQTFPGVFAVFCDDGES